MVLILGEICLKPGDTNDCHGIEASWQHCLDILDEMSPNHIAAEKCAKTLVSMRKQAMSSNIGASSPLVTISTYYKHIADFVT